MGNNFMKCKEYLKKLYKEIPNDLIGLEEFLNLFKDLINDNITVNEEKIIKRRVYKLLINSRYNIEFVNYFVNTGLKDNYSVHNVNSFINILDSFIDYNRDFINIDVIISLLRLNSKFYKIAEIKYNYVKSRIKEKGLNEFTTNRLLNLLVRGYILINNIDIEERNFISEIRMDYTSDSLRQYLNEIKQYPLLSLDQEKTLIIEAQKGNQEAKNRIIESNLRLVSFIVVKKYSRRKLSVLDLIQEGNLGLMKAIEKYNINIGIKFSNYASYWIENYINRALMTKENNICLPVHFQEKMAKYKKIFNILENEKGREPTDYEMQQATGLSKEYIKLIKNYMYDTLSHNDKIGEQASDDKSFIDSKCDLNVNVEREVIHKEEIRLLNYVLNNNYLTSQEIDILKRRNGFNGEVEKLEDISKIYHLSRERIRQIEENALFKVKKEFINIKVKNISNIKFKALLCYFPGYTIEQLIYVISKLRYNEYEVLYKIYHDDYNNPSFNILNNYDIDNLFNVIFPKIKILLKLEYNKDNIEVIDSSVSVKLLKMIKDLKKNGMVDLSFETLSIGLLKTGVVDGKMYDLSSIAKLMDLDGITTYYKYVQFEDYLSYSKEFKLKIKSIR